MVWTRGEESGRCTRAGMIITHVHTYTYIYLYLLQSNEEEVLGSERSSMVSWERGREMLGRHEEEKRRYREWMGGARGIP